MEQRPGAPGELPDEAGSTARRLLAAGLEVLDRAGLEAARVDDVVAAAGTSHGTFYLYFRDRDDLVRALAIEAAARLRVVAGSLAAVDGTDEQALRAWLATLAEVHAPYRAVLQLWSDQRMSDPLAKAFGEESFEAFVTAFAGQLDARATPPDHPRLEAIALVGMIDRFLSFRTRTGRRAQSDSALEPLAALLAAALS